MTYLAFRPQRINTWEPRGGPTGGFWPESNKTYKTNIGSYGNSATMKSLECNLISFIAFLSTQSSILLVVDEDIYGGHDSKAWGGVCKDLVKERVST